MLNKQLADDCLHKWEDSGRGQYGPRQKCTECGAVCEREKGKIVAYDRSAGHPGKIR